MRDKPLSTIGARLFRRHGDASSQPASQERPAAAEYRLDRAPVTAFLDGTLDPEGERVLALQVARLLPFQWTLPASVTAEMSRITDHLGDQRALLAWLDRHPGRPRLAARLYVLLGLLDRYGDDPAVVTALREFRERVPYPPGLEDHLVPATGVDTLAGLAFSIESLLGEDLLGDAARLALATVTVLQEVAPRAAELDPGLRDLGDLMDQVGQDIRAAAAEI